MVHSILRWQDKGRGNLKAVNFLEVFSDDPAFFGKVLEYGVIQQYIDDIEKPNEESSGAHFLHTTGHSGSADMGVTVVTLRAGWVVVFFVHNNQPESEYSYPE